MKEEKKIKFESDTERIYECGCSESKLEAPEYYETMCSVHQQEKDCKEGKHRFVACDEWEPTCIGCGKFQT